VADAREEKRTGAAPGSIIATIITHHMAKIRSV
jgi:hypothetical protein